MSRTLPRLDDYVTGELDDAEAAAFEEEMFAAVGADAASEADTRFFDRAHRLIAAFVATGGLAGPSTEKDIERLRTAGMNVHVVDFLPGGEVDVGPWPDDAQLIVFRAHVDARGWDDVEVEVENPDGTPIKTFRGVECDPDNGRIYAVCWAPLAQMAYGTTRRISRITGVRDGKRETISVLDTRPRAV